MIQNDVKLFGALELTYQIVHSIMYLTSRNTTNHNKLISKLWLVSTLIGWALLIPKCIYLYYFINRENFNALIFNPTFILNQHILALLDQLNVLDMVLPMFFTKWTNNSRHILNSNIIDCCIMHNVLVKYIICVTFTYNNINSLVIPNYFNNQNVLSFCSMIIMCIVHCSQMQFRNTSRINQRNLRNYSENRIKIPGSFFTHYYELSQNLSIDMTCPICQEDAQENDKWRKLLCNHIFHSKCIDDWIQIGQNTCPMCRAQIFF